MRQEVHSNMELTRTHTLMQVKGIISEKGIWIRFKERKGLEKKIPNNKDSPLPADV
jgi:hypothetical protein